MTIIKSSIFTPDPGALVELRLTDGGRRSHSWSIQLASGIWVPNDRRNWSVKLEGQIISAGPAEGIDMRLSNQQASINRLLKHLQSHCGDLTGCANAVR